jgi:hypothetical protein
MLRLSGREIKMSMQRSFAQIAPEWFADDAMKDLISEQQMMPEETPISIGLKDLESYFPLAVRRVGHIAVHGDDEKTALAAAKYVIAANLQLQKARVGGEDDPVEAFAKSVMDEASALKAQGQWDQAP